MPKLNTVAGLMLTYTGQTMAAGDEITAKKSLGQHWLTDLDSLAAIVSMADISEDNLVVEIGPGTGLLTKLLAPKANKVIAIELDSDLISHLGALNISNLEIDNIDVMKFNFENLPEYKIVANIPYYLTGKIVKLLSELDNKPSLVVLLVQKEIAERLSAKPGDLSILGLTCQYYWKVEKGLLITADKFEPPPKVDSQVVRLTPKATSLSKDNQVELFRLIKLGFASKRKTILNNLASGLHKDKETIKKQLLSIGIEDSRRPQTLSLNEWQKLLETTN